jgi:hypothetical protein
MAEPIAVGMRSGAPPDAGAAIKQRAEELSRANMPLDPVEVLTTLQPQDVIGTALIAFALSVGPGPWLAPLGIGTDIRPARRMALLIAKAAGMQEEQWARDAADGFDFELPVPIVVCMVLLFGLLGLITERVLLLALDDSVNFVLSLSGSLAIAAAFFELIRPRLESRTEFDENERRYEEFEAFASELLTRSPAASCHESDVVRSFRTFYPKYRAASGKISDKDIESLMRRWGRFERTPAGYYKGISLKPNSLTTVF